jgi:hypothetical protein
MRAKVPAARITEIRDKSCFVHHRATVVVLRSGMVDGVTFTTASLTAAGDCRPAQMNAKFADSTSEGAYEDMEEYLGGVEKHIGLAAVNTFTRL